MEESLMQLMRLLGDEEPQLRRRRIRNSNKNGRRQNTQSNTGTQNMEGLINNTGYVEGNGNGCIILGGFDSSTKTFD